jgi:hypothetical protein
VDGVVGSVAAERLPLIVEFNNYSSCFEMGVTVVGKTRHIQGGRLATCCFDCQDVAQMRNKSFLKCACDIRDQDVSFYVFHDFIFPQFSKT